MLEKCCTVLRCKRCGVSNKSAWKHFQGAHASSTPCLLRSITRPPVNRHSAKPGEPRLGVGQLCDTVVCVSGEKLNPTKSTDVWPSYEEQKSSNRKGERLGRAVASVSLVGQNPTWELPSPAVNQRPLLGHTALRNQVPRCPPYPSLLSCWLQSSV
jgi:hypothetical protein